MWWLPSQFSIYLRLLFGSFLWGVSWTCAFMVIYGNLLMTTHEKLYLGDPNGKNRCNAIIYYRLYLTTILNYLYTNDSTHELFALQLRHNSRSQVLLFDVDPRSLSQGDHTPLHFITTCNKSLLPYIIWHKSFLRLWYFSYIYITIDKLHIIFWKS